MAVFANDGVLAELKIRHLRGLTVPWHYFRFSCMRGNPKSCSIVLSVLTQLTIMHLNSTQRVVAQLHCQIHNKVQRNPSNELLQVNSSQFETLKFS